MPKFTFECKDCDFTKDLLRPTCPPVGVVVCGHCNKPMARLAGAASSRMVEVLDNGLMTKRVERPANAEALYKERARDAEAAKNKL